MTMKITDKKNPNAFPFVAFSEDGLLKAELAFAKLVFDRIASFQAKMEEEPEFKGHEEVFSQIFDGIICGMQFLGNERHALIEAGEIKEQVFSDDEMDNVKHLVSLFNEKLADVTELMVKNGINVEEDDNGTYQPKLNKKYEKMFKNSNAEEDKNE